MDLLIKIMKKWLHRQLSCSIWRTPNVEISPPVRCRHRVPLHRHRSARRDCLPFQVQRRQRQGSIRAGSLEILSEENRVSGSQVGSTRGSETDAGSDHCPGKSEGTFTFAVL